MATRERSGAPTGERNVAAASGERSARRPAEFLRCSPRLGVAFAPEERGHERDGWLRFSEGAELLDVCWLSISGKIRSKMLSPNSTYTAYMVFKYADDSYGLDSPNQEASVSFGETKSTRQVCLQVYDDEDGGVPESVLIPQKRTGDWMELELGEFFNEGGEDGDVSVWLNGTHGGHWKKGLIVQGVEIRLKKSG